MSENQQEVLLEKILSENKKQSAYARVQGFSMAGILIIVVVCFILIVPSALKTVNEANNLIEQAAATIETIDAAVVQINTMSATLSKTGENMNNFIVDNSQSVSDTMKKIEEIDFEGLNQAIKDLGDTVEPFADFFNKFK